MHGHQFAVQFLVGRGRRCWRHAVKSVTECWWPTWAGWWCGSAPDQSGPCARGNTVCTRFVARQEANATPEGPELHGRVVSGRARVSPPRAGLCVVPVSPPGGRRGRRCSSRGVTAQRPRPVAQTRRGRVLDEQSVDGAGGKNVPEQPTRDMFTPGQLWVDPHVEIADDGRWLDDTVVNPNGRVRWKPPEVHRRAEPKKLSLPSWFIRFIVNQAWTWYGHSYNGRRIGTYTRHIQWCKFEWLWVTEWQINFQRHGTLHGLFATAEFLVKLTVIFTSASDSLKFMLEYYKQHIGYTLLLVSLDVIYQVGLWNSSEY